MNPNDQYILTFLRHGESVGNVERRYQGQAEFPLTPLGREQAHALARCWLAEGRQFDEIISSPQSRARETTEIIAAALGLDVTYDEIWMERNNGSMAGLTHTEVLARYPQQKSSNPFENARGGGEGDWALFLRAGQAIQGLITKKPGKYLIVSHGGLLNQVMHAILGITPKVNFGELRFQFKNTGFAQVAYDPHHHRWTIERVNDRAHWAEKNEGEA